MRELLELRHGDVDLRAEHQSPLVEPRKAPFGVLVLVAAAFRRLADGEEQRAN